MIYAIIGPTAVGKTKLSVELAKKLKNTEIINCDSMQIYKQLNIGVAKIKEEEKENIKHHLFDIKNIDEEFSCFDYQVLGRNLINKLLKEGKNVIIVGGTGLYLKALLYNYNFDNKDTKNQKLYNFTLIGLTRNRENLYNLINKRVDIMFDEGLFEEAKALYEKNKDARALKYAIGYKELFEYFDGKCSLDSAKDKIKQASRRYAKRQYTFFKNQFSDIKWYDVDSMSVKDIVEDITKAS